MENTRILIVEDNIIIASDLASELRQWGYEVTGISMTGSEALDAAKKDRPDLIIIDIEMPGGMDGIETAKKIASEFSVPFIYLTAYSNDLLVQRARETGPYGYILKPYRPNELHITIEMALRKHDMERRIEEVKQQLEIEVEERKRTEERLRQSEELYRVLIESSADSIYVLDREWRHLMVNQSATRFVGMQKEQLVGNKLTDLFPGIEETDFFREFKRVMTERSPGLVSTEYNYPDGRSGWYEVTVSPVPEGILCISRDITKRKQAEEALRESEEKYRDIVEGARAIVLKWDTSGKVLFLNEYGERFFGYKKDEIIGKNVVGTIVPAADSTGRDLSAMIAEISTNPDRFSDNENENITKEGRRVWVRWSNRSVCDAKNEITGILSIGHDITLRKITEAALSESENRYFSLFNNSIEMICVVDLNGVIVDANQHAFDTVGYGREDLGTISISDLFEGDDRSRVISDMGEIVRTGKQRGISEYRLKKKNGDILYIENTASLISRQGKPRAVIIIARDITERKRAEEALRASEEKFSKMFQFSPVSLGLSVLENGIYLDINESYLRMTGFSREEVIGRSSLNLGIWVDPAERARIRKKVAITGTVQGEKVQLRTRNGSIITVKFSAAQIIIEGVPCMISAAEDITYLERTESELRKSREELQSMFDGAPIMMCVVDHDRKVVRGNRAFQEACGWPVSEAESDTACGILGCVHTLDDPRGCGYSDDCASCEMRAAIEGTFRDGAERIGVEQEFTLVRKGRSEVIYLMGSTTLLLSHENQILLLCLQDISGLKKAERLLMESEQKLKAVVDGSSIPQFFIDNDHCVVYWNKALEKISGMRAGDVIGTRDHWEAFYPQERPCMADLLLEKQGVESRLEEWYGDTWKKSDYVDGAFEAVNYLPHFANGGKWLHFTAASIQSAEGRVIGVLETLIDISDRKTVELELAKSEKKYRELADFMPEIIFEMDENGLFTYANRAAFTMLGYKPEEMVQIQFIDLFLPDDRERLMRNYLSIRNGERSVPHEYTLIRRDGTRLPVIINSRAIMIDGSYRGARGIVVDITERRRIETALRESEVKFHSLFTNSGDAQLLMEGALIVDCNMAAMRMMGVSDRDQIVGQYIQQFFPDMQPDGKSSLMKGIGFLKRAIVEKSLKFEWQHRRVDGGMFIAEVVFTAIPVEGKVLFHTTLRDITERKQLQEQIINIVDIEQQRLGQNLHDGLGQELTGVAFLCNSLTKRLRELSLPEMARSEELTNQIYRIITMVRTLSRELYPPNLVENEISFTLADFAANIQKMFGISCIFEQDEDLVISNINVSTQIYYITREAVNNAIRHGKARNIIIKLTTDADRVILMISDDGEGIPHRTDKTSGLGLRIMAYRMESIHGTFGLRRAPGGGTQVTCTMPRHVTEVEG